MKAALVGLGYWGKTILPILKSLENSLNFKLQHVCEHNKKNLNECIKNWPSTIIHSDFDKLIEYLHKVKKLYNLHNITYFKKIVPI